MNLTRRDAMRLAAGAAIVAALPIPVFASTPETVEEAIAAFTGGAAVKEGGVDITAPEIAENGNTVPVEVAASGATSIMLHYPPYYGVEKTLDMLRLFAKEVLPHIQGPGPAAVAAE